MPRHSKPTELDIQSANGLENGVQSGSMSSPIHLQGVDLTSFGGGFEHDVAAGLTPLPPLPQSPPGSPRLQNTRDPSKTFLSSFKKQEQKQKEPRQRSNEEEDMRPGTSNMSTKIYHLRKNPGSTPELSLVGSTDSVHQDPADGSNLQLSARPQGTPEHSEDGAASSKRAPFKIGINRSKSIRRDSETKPKFLRPSGKDHSEHQAPPKTAPLQSDWPGSSHHKAFLGKEKDKRGKSAERAASESEENMANRKQRQAVKNAMQKGKNVGSGFLTRLGKIGRSSSNSHEKDMIADADYQLQVINQPLVEQTRITRISKQLSECRDKTEYWMPALPWRCIDFLNTRCEQEGLYRIPGSGPHVKQWQRRFDIELDIDLLSEEVRDTNEIASMLKAWLRGLPTEIMPAAIQHSLSLELEKENPRYRNVGEPVSPRLRTVLSELPPFNYYLLFAITCHLSLLLANKERNKMDLNNLAVCVMPCLNLERWLFNYLVGDWRNCWQGCYTEKEYLRIEAMVEQGLDPHQLHGMEMGDGRSLNSGFEATTIEDAPSEAVSVSSFVEDRTFSSGSGSATSNPTSSSEDARHGHWELAEQHMDGDISPMTYMPTGANVFSTGPVGLGIEQDTKRPRTADQRYMPEDTKQLHNSNTTTKSRSNSSTPRVGHNRSRSDLPPTPVNTDFNIPIRPSS